TQRGQLQLVSLEWVPFYVLFLLRAVHDWPPLRAAGQIGRWLVRAALPAAAFLVLIALVDWYYVMYMVLVTLLYGLYLAGRSNFGFWILDFGLRFRPGRKEAKPALPNPKLAVAWAGEAVLRLGAIGVLVGLAVSPILVPLIQEAQTAS